MVEILSEPYQLSLSQTGSMLAVDDAFGTIEGYKLTADLISPVSGVILEVNLNVLLQGQVEMVVTINNDPYNSGWMIVVRLDNPNESTILRRAARGWRSPMRPA